MARFDDELRVDELTSPYSDRNYSDRAQRDSSRPGCLRTGCMVSGALVGVAMLLGVGALAGGLASDKIRDAIWGKGNPEPQAVVIRADVMHPAQREVYITQNVSVEITAEQQRVQGIWRNVPGASLLDSQTRVVIQGECMAGMDLEGDEPTYDISVEQRAATITIPNSVMLGCTIDPNGGITFIRGNGILPVSDEGLRNRALAVGLGKLPEEGIRQHMPDQATQRAKEVTAKRAEAFGYDPRKIKVDVRPAKPKDRSPRPVASPQVVR